MVRAPISINTKDYELGKVQDLLAQFFRRLFVDVPILDGALIENVAITSSDTIVPHGLRRAFRGYFIVGKNAAEHVFTSSTVNNRPQDQIILKASGAVTASLYVF